MFKLQIGKIVEWETSGKGSNRCVGIIEDTLDAGESVLQRGHKLSASVYDVSKRDRYIVRVTETNGRVLKKSKLMCPIRADLEKRAKVAGGSDL